MFNLSYKVVNMSIFYVDLYQIIYQILTIFHMEYIYTSLDIYTKFENLCVPNGLRGSYKNIELAIFVLKFPYGWLFPYDLIMF